MKHVTQSFKVDERVVWIETGGLPLNAWTSKSYKKIACNWGEPLFFDEDPHDNVVIGRVCIRTKIQGQITETCKVVIHGQSHNVRVKEFPSWVPDIEAMDSLSGKNFDMGISDNHDDANSDNGSQDAEEGDKRETNKVNEENVVNSHHFSWVVDEVNIAKITMTLLLGISLKKVKSKLPQKHQKLQKVTQKPYRNLLVLKTSNLRNIKTLIKPLHPFLERNRHVQAHLINKLKEFDAATVRGFGNIMADSQRSTWLKNLRNIKLKENLDVSQKAIVKWGIEADENTKFFHAIGDVVKIIDQSPFYKTLREDQNSFLVSTVSEAEIRNAIWDCGSDKSPGPDGFTFAFYKKFWDTIKDDVTVFVQDFFNTGILPQGCNNSFIALIPKISNPVVVICFMGFSEKWITWIKGCLYLATSLVLVNGSPTREFHINRGLRQGDPLSPFLFIIAMEGLHVAVEDYISTGLYRVLASKEKGGLGIGSLYSLNHALIQKWRWHFFNNPQALWVLLIKAIHSEHGDGSSFYNHVRDQGVWGRIVRSINSMHEKDCTISDCRNNGWDLSWSRPITSGTNAHHLSTLSNLLATCSLTDTEDTWTWSLSLPSFTVKSTRDHIDNFTLLDGDLETRLNRYLPKKINIFIWRDLRNRLPTRYRYIRTELITPDLTCPSTHQLLKNFGGDSGPDLSFDKSASPERLFGLARVSLAEASKLDLSFKWSGRDYTSSMYTFIKIKSDYN
nr:RNA-directed DNA polymerase, eukaryota, reverse transcriptase zinc-binding domain protein [Tanacetum cinerariifolium]